MSLDELCDIVDENDRVIGQAARGEAWKQGHIHRISRVMVEDKDGNILLQKRANKLTWPNCWDNSAAGHVDAGEDYLTAAKRELFEEIGVETSALEEIGSYFTDVTNAYGILKRFNRVYRTIIDYTPDTLQASEVAEVRWFTPTEVKQLITTQRQDVTDGLYDVITRYY